MARIVVYGASDDLIEVEGDMRDEWGGGDWRYLHFNDGTVVKIGYDQIEGRGWHVTPVKVAKGTTVSYEAPVVEDGHHYTDRLVLEGDITSANVWKSPDGPDAESIRDFFDDFYPGDYSYDRLLGAYKALKEPADK